MTSWLELTIGLGAVVCIAGIVVFARRRRRNRSPLGLALGGVAADELTHCLIPDGLGGEIYIDTLLLTPDGALLLDVINVEGTVFAGTNLDEWSATGRNGRFAFENPLPALLNREAAVREAAPGLPVTPMVLFTNDVTFPKGRPTQVLTMAQFQERHSAASGSADSFIDIWNGLKTVARPAP